jgi:hypothetical protein
MSSRSLAVPSHTFASSVRRAFSRSAASSAGSVSFSGPSTFDVPESLMVEAQPGRLSFSFDYPDSELPESRSRAGIADGTIALQLGEKTKRVLRVEFYGNVDELLQSRLSAARKIEVRFEDALTNQAHNSFRQSIALVTDILTSMPNEVISDLRQNVQETHDHLAEL